LPCVLLGTRALKSCSRLTGFSSTDQTRRYANCSVLQCGQAYIDAFETADCNSLGPDFNLNNTWDTVIIKDTAAVIQPLYPTQDLASFPVKGLHYMTLARETLTVLIYSLASLTLKTRLLAGHVLNPLGRIRRLL
jgi:hypothetical protein